MSWLLAASSCLLVGVVIGCRRRHILGRQVSVMASTIPCLAPASRCMLCVFHLVDRVGVVVHRRIARPCSAKNVTM